MDLQSFLEVVPPFLRRRSKGVAARPDGYQGTGTSPLEEPQNRNLSAGSGGHVQRALEGTHAFEELGEQFFLVNEVNELLSRLDLDLEAGLLYSLLIQQNKLN